MLRTNRHIAATAFSLLLGLAACDNEEVFRPGNLTPVDPMFTRYVSLGNSITAGFQSNGINDSTQGQAYPVLLSRAMTTPLFFVPFMNKPGCPAPYDSVFAAAGPHRISNIPCALRRAQSTPVPYINNVAVPGAEVMDGITNTDTASNSNALTTFFLGGLTQTQMMQRVNPTFVTVWLGNNDVLGAATYPLNYGDSTRITDTTVFKQRYTAVLDSIDATPAAGQGVLIGVANVTLIPYFSKGDTYFFIKAGTASFPTNFLVGANCAPDTLGGQGTTTLVPFPYGLGLVGLARANPGNTYTLDCNATLVVVPQERAKLIAAVNSYNTFIAAQATARGYAFADPNALFSTLPAGSIPAFPNTTGTNAVTRPFGDYFSRDGVHPSALAHRLVANALRTAINAQYGTSIPAIP
jgi:GDSL-like lipase/acylhydrolase family protein